MAEYLERRCEVCKTPFAPAYPWTVTCSKDCWNVRRKKQKCDSGNRARAKRKAYLLDLLADFAVLQENIDWLNCYAETRNAEHKKVMSDLVMHMTNTHELELQAYEADLQKVRAELAALKEKQPAAQEATQTEPKPVEKPKEAQPAKPFPVDKQARQIGKKLHECKRLNLVATELGCGVHLQCFEPPCENLPEKDKEKVEAMKKAIIANNSRPGQFVNDYGPLEYCNF